MGCGPIKVKKSILWSPPPIGSFKFNVDGPTRGKPGPAGIGGVFRNCNGDVLFMFSEYVGVRNSNEAEVLAILESLWCFLRYYQGNVIVKSDSSNAVN